MIQRVNQGKRMVFQKQHFNMEEKELLSGEVEHDFINDLIEYFTIIKQHVPDDVNEIIKVCKELYELYTKPFYEKWSSVNLVEWNSEYQKNYYSFILVYIDVKILLPHRLLIFETLQPENNIIEQLKKAQGTNYFFFTLNKIQRGLNLTLLPNDIKIIDVLMNPLIRNRITTLPTNRQIATLTQCSENTISRRLEHLINRAMFTNKYRIDMALLGYYTSAIIHLEHFDDIPPTMEPYCLVDVPIDWGEKVGKIKIFQVPYSRKNLMGEIKDYFNSLYEMTLTKSYIGWNLSGLTTDIDNRWRVLPPIFLGDRWSDTLIAEGVGIEHNLFNDMTVVKISETQAKMLDLLQVEATSNVHLSQTLGVTPKYIQQFYEYFFEQRLIDRFLQIGHVGLDSKVWITLLGSKSDSNFSLLNNIVEHLKFFPFSWIFYNEKNLDLDGKPLLAGVLWIPSSWFVDFYGVWIHLIDLGFVPKINISQGVIKWGSDIQKTYDFDARNT